MMTLLRKIREDVSLPQILASGGGAITVATLTTQTGIAGTTIGILTGAVIGSLSNTIYKHSISSSTQALREVVIKKGSNTPTLEINLEEIDKKLHEAANNDTEVAANAPHNGEEEGDAAGEDTSEPTPTLGTLNETQQRALQEEITRQIVAGVNQQLREASLIERNLNKAVKRTKWGRVKATLTPLIISLVTAGGAVLIYNAVIGPQETTVNAVPDIIVNTPQPQPTHTYYVTDPNAPDSVEGESGDAGSPSEGSDNSEGEGSDGVAPDEEGRENTDDGSGGDEDVDKPAGSGGGSPAQPTPSPTPTPTPVQPTPTPTPTPTPNPTPTTPPVAPAPEQSDGEEGTDGEEIGGDVTASSEPEGLRDMIE